MPAGSGKGDSKSVRMGGAFVELFSKDTLLKRGLLAAESRLRKFGTFAATVGKQFGSSLFSFADTYLGSAIGNLMGGLKKAATAGLAGGAGLLGGVALLAKNWLDWAGDIQDASDRLGTTTDQISALAFAAEQSGATLEDVEGAVKNLFKSLGSNEGVKAIKSIGIDADELGGQPLVEQIAMIADGLAGVQEGADRGALALKIFGKGGLTLLPLLKDGAAGVRELVADANAVGAVISGEQAAEAERTGDLISRAWTSAKFAIMSVASAILPQEATFKRISDAIVNAVGSIREWVTNNKDLVRLGLLGVAAITGLSGAFLVFGPALGAFASLIAIPAQLAIAGLAGGIGLLATTAGVAGSMFTGFLGITATLLSGLVSVAGFLFSPAGLLVGGVAIATGFAGRLVNVVGGIAEVFRGLPSAIRGTIGALGTFGGDVLRTLGAAFDGIGERFKGVMESVAQIAKETWGGIVSAIGRGDLAAAGKIAVAGLKLAWAAMKPELLGVWNSLMTGLRGAWDSLVSNLETTWSKVAVAVSAVVNDVKGLLDHPVLVLLVKRPSSTLGEMAKDFEGDAGEMGPGELGRLEGAPSGWDFIVRNSPGFDPAYRGPSSLSGDAMSRSRRAAALQAEAIMRGLDSDTADMISKWTMEGEREVGESGATTPGSAAMKELLKRRAMNFRAGDTRHINPFTGRFMESPMPSEAVMKEAGGSLGRLIDIFGGVGDDARKSFDETLRNSSSIWTNYKELKDLTDAERNQPRPGAAAMPSDLKKRVDDMTATLPALTKGMFSGPFAQSLGLADKISEKQLKEQQGTRKAAEGVEREVKILNANFKMR